MNKTELAEFVKKADPSCEIKEGKQFAEVTVTPDKLYATAKMLKTGEETSFDFLVLVTGVDYGKELGVVYHLRSTKFGHTIVLKTRIQDREKPAVDSVCDLWHTAEFHEREAYDLVGIRFNNHPDLRRLFLDSSWGFPLRKDYVDDVNIVTK